MPGQVYSFSEMAKVYREHDRTVEDAVKVIRKTVKVSGPRRVQEVISALARKPVDRGTYRRSFQYEDIEGGATVYNSAPYAAVIEYGRRKGAKGPPLKVLMEWVVRKKLVAGGRKANQSDVRGVAWLIQRAIKRRGIPGRHVLGIASRNIQADVRQALRAELGGGGAHNP